MQLALLLGQQLLVPGRRGRGRLLALLDSLLPRAWSSFSCWSAAARRSATFSSFLEDLLELADLLAALLRLPLGLHAQLVRLVLGLEQRLLLPGLGLPFGVAEEPARLLLGAPDGLGGNPLARGDPVGKRPDGGDGRRDGRRSR